MKRKFIVLLGLAVIGSNLMSVKGIAREGVKSQTQKPASQAADIAKGKELISKSDCLACHKPDVRLVGPAYKEVAAKYKPTEANINVLSKKVIEGGSGVWGQVPMTPHPTVQLADAKKMVKYILSIK